jgi:hypothetical protein
VTAILVGVFSIASIAVVSQVSLPEGVPSDVYRGFDENSSTIMVSSILRALSLGLMAVPLVYLFRAAQARSERVNRLMLGFAVIPPALLAIQSILLWVGQNQLSSDLISHSAVGGDVYSLFRDLNDDSSLILAASAIGQVGGLGLVVGLVYVLLQSMRVGLLTRFFATLGMALAVASILLQLPLVPLGLWFGWLGGVILDRVPNGRPPAWDAGVAIPWPRPGDEPLTPEPVVVEGDATEVFEPVDRSGRRERARKRKRKRRS